MLYARELHEPLTKTPWSEARARDAVQAIVADAERAYSADVLWPAHGWDGYRAALPMKNLYVGAAGVVWGLNRLRRRGYDSSSTPPRRRNARSSCSARRRTMSRAMSFPSKSGPLC